MTPLYILTLVLALFFTALSLRFLIPILKSRKMGQKILDIGPRWHKSKEGTPTMGGLSFMIVFTVLCGVMLAAASGGKTTEELLPAVAVILFALGNGLIGVIDDRTKFSKGKNEGLLSWQKYLLQLLLCVLYLFALAFLDRLDTSIRLPFFGRELELGLLYYPLVIILITGVVNSVNLTDGIDGLAAGETAIVSAFFSAVAFTIGSVTLGILAGAAVGCCLGFLVYNFHPARVFMGDTGSLFLGGLVVGMAFLIDNPLILIAVGFMYILESLSDIIQVLYFKLTHGKRFFRMAPIHHHFEKCGWSEVRIVTVFCAATLLLCTLAYFFDIL